MPMHSSGAAARAPGTREHRGKRHHGECVSHSHKDAAVLLSSRCGSESQHDEQLGDHMVKVIFFLLQEP